MKSLAERRKQVDLENLSPEDAERIGEEVGKKIGAICSDAEAQINNILAVYGEKCVVAIQIIDKKTGKPRDAVTF